MPLNFFWEPFIEIYDPFCGWVACFVFLVVCCCCCWFVFSAWCILDNDPLVDMYLTRIFPSHSVHCIFTPLNASFAVQKPLMDVRSYCQLLVSFSEWQISFRKPLPVPVFCSTLYTSSSCTFKVSDFTVRSLIFELFEADFCSGWQIRVYPLFFSHHLWKMISFLQYVFFFVCVSLSNIWWSYVVVWMRNVSHKLG